MTTYLERFQINRCTYGIEKVSVDGKQGFKLWAGGCGIGGNESLESARKLLHTYVCNQLRAEIRSHQRLLNNAEDALSLLEGDAFYLGRFIT